MFRRKYAGLSRKGESQRRGFKRELSLKIPPGAPTLKNSGKIPGGGAVQHLTRLMGRGRALEVLLSVADYDAELAERYGWVNRALPADAHAINDSSKS